ncbi:MAG: hypothetical protein LCI00_16350 [Chloroflexi bacterium]|nr:hypothetical protein [Chloroflexota bacterium]MCC6892804.1 hypothetical protein [Anaerolineae bacterium]
MGRKQNHQIVLSAMERAELEGIVKGGQNKVRVVHHREGLLAANPYRQPFQ